MLAKYIFASGHLRFMKSHIELGNLTDLDIATGTLEFYNAWQYPMTLSFIEEMPDFIKFEPTILKLPPKTEGKVIFKYDAAKRNFWGKVSNFYSFQTNDTIELVKNFSIACTISPNTSSLTAIEKANPPKISFKDTIHDFGSIIEGEKVSFNFEFTNIGKGDLKILQASSSCGCTASAPDEYIIKPNNKSFIAVTFDSKERHGIQKKSITVITNDPLKETIILTITSNVSGEYTH